MKNVVITGASDGLGYEIAKVFSNEGSNVINLSRTKSELPNIKTIKTDLTNNKEIDQAVKEIYEDFQHIDVLINNAGVLLIEEMGNIDYLQSEKVIRLNLLAPIYLTSKLSELIVKGEGDIVNIGSTSGYKGRRNWAVYGASKWGLRGLHENLKDEFHDSKVRVTLFNPPAFKSNHFQKAGIEIDDMSAFLEPADLAGMVFNITEAPKQLQVGEILINKKPV